MKKGEWEEVYSAFIPLRLRVSAPRTCPAHAGVNFRPLTEFKFRPGIRPENLRARGRPDAVGRDQRLSRVIETRLEARLILLSRFFEQSLSMSVKINGNVI